MNSLRQMIPALLAAAVLVGCGGTAPTARERIHRYNLDQPDNFRRSWLDSVLTGQAGRPTARRIGDWARRFLAEGDVVYLNGLDPGGYVDLGRIALDRRQDCVSLVYRCTELARAGSAAAAIDTALATRFAGAPVDSLADSRGRVDYDRPEHLDFSLDMIRSGHWGRDITAGLAGAAIDTAGSSRYPPGSFSYVADWSRAGGGLREGDIVWFVLNPDHPQARRLRREFGLVIGHLGLVVRDEGEPPSLVHAASGGLPGLYPAGRIVAVDLGEYLDRVDRFCGFIVTRFEDQE